VNWNFCSGRLLFLDLFVLFLGHIAALARCGLLLLQE